VKPIFSSSTSHCSILICHVMSSLEIIWQFNSTNITLKSRA
jgi:hypothetical protein